MSKNTVDVVGTLQHLMWSRLTAMQHHSGPESGVPIPSEGPLTGEESCPPAGTRNVEDNHNSRADTTESASSCASPSSGPADDTKESPQLKSSTLDHLEACMVPHVFASSDLNPSAWTSRDMSVRSVSDALGGETVQGDGEQPPPCFTGCQRRTTDVDAVKEQYEGVNILRCDPGPGGNCLEDQMKHRADFENLFDRRVNLKYNRSLRHVTEDFGNVEYSLELL